MKNFLLICLFMIFAVAKDASAQANWIYYNINNLPKIGTPSSIASDTWMGGIFLGYSGGLAKYNGQEWVKVYYNEIDPMSGGNEYKINVMKTIFETVWAGTDKGIIKFESQNKKIYNLENTPSMKNDKITGIAFDQDANVWFMNNQYGIFKLNRSVDTVVKYTIPEGTPLPFSKAKMFFDAEDNLWYMASEKIVKFNNGNVKVIDSNEIVDLKTDTLQSIQIAMENYKGVLMILMKKNIGIYRDQSGVVSYDKIDYPENLLDEDEFFHSLTVDMEGNLWILSRITFGQAISSRHFYRYSKDKEWSKYEFPQFEGTETNLYSITDFTADKNGKVWFVSPYNGVFVFDPKATSVEDMKSDLITISPNPAENYIEVTKGIINPKLKNGVDEPTIQIYNTLCEIVLSVGPSRDRPSRIDISDLTAGVYFVKCGNEIAKFVKN